MTIYALWYLLLGGLSASTILRGSDGYATWGELVTAIAIWPIVWLFVIIAALRYH